MSKLHKYEHIERLIGLEKDKMEKNILKCKEFSSKI